MSSLTSARVKELIDSARRQNILVVGDVMLDQFVWGSVSRISPEAPVPVLNFERESFMPGGAANVARNLTSLKVPTQMDGIIGKDDAGKKLRALLKQQQVDCSGLLEYRSRTTSIKTRIVADRQQIVRVDREAPGEINDQIAKNLIRTIQRQIKSTTAIIIGDYGKGLVSQYFLDQLKGICRERAVWLSLDPKPIHLLNLSGLSLITPNRKETFELAGLRDTTKHQDPLKDYNLIQAARKLLRKLRPAILLITLGERGMLLCRRGQKPFHIPTVARETFDVSGAGDTVIASFTLAIAAGASPIEASVFSNHAAGVVVGKVGTATVTERELLASFSGAS